MQFMYVKDRPPSTFTGVILDEWSENLLHLIFLHKMKIFSDLKMG